MWLIYRYYFKFDHGFLILSLIRPGIIDKNQIIGPDFTGINMKIGSHLSHLSKWPVDLYFTFFFPSLPPSSFFHIFQNWYKHDKLEISVFKTSISY